MLEGVNKKYVFCAIGVIVVVLGIFVTHLFSEHGPSSPKAIMKGCVEYVMKEYGAEEDGKSAWSSYKDDESDLKLEKGSAIEICRILERGDFDEESDARKYVLKGVTYSIAKCEIYDDVGLVTINMDSPVKGKSVGTFEFKRTSGDWKIDKESLYSVLMAGNGIGGSGNHITDIFDALAS